MPILGRNAIGGTDPDRQRSEKHIGSWLLKDQITLHD